MAGGQRFEQTVLVSVDKVRHLVLRNRHSVERVIGIKFIPKLDAATIVSTPVTRKVYGIRVALHFGNIVPPVVDIIC